MHDLAAAVSTSSAPLLTTVEQPLQEQCAQLYAHTAAISSATASATATSSAATTSSAAAGAGAVNTTAAAGVSSCPEWLQAMARGEVQGQTAVATEQAEEPIADVAATSSTSSSSSEITASESVDVSVAAAAAAASARNDVAELPAVAPVRSDSSELVREHRSADVSSDVTAWYG